MYGWTINLIHKAAHEPEAIWELATPPFWLLPISAVLTMISGILHQRIAKRMKTEISEVEQTDTNHAD